MFENSLVITDIEQKKVIHVIAITKTPFMTAKVAIENDFILRALNIMSQAGLTDKSIDVSGDVFDVYRKYSARIGTELKINKTCQFGKYLLQFSSISVV